MKKSPFPHALDHLGGTGTHSLSRADPVMESRIGDTKQRVAPFDPHKRAQGEALRQRVAELVATLEAYELETAHRRKKRGPQGQRKFGVAVEAIVCNFLVLDLIAPDWFLVLPLGHQMLEGNRLARSEVYGTHFNDAVNALVSLGLIERHTRGFYVRGQSSQPSTYSASAGFLESMRGALESGLNDIGQSMTTPVIIMKGIKDSRDERHVVDFRETTKTAQMRKEMVAINGWLAGLPIGIDLKDIRRINQASEDGRLLDPTQRRLRRSFVNNDFQQGGRLFGGFWETMDREDRFQCLRLGNSEGMMERVVNVDYGQFNPRLSYSLAHLPAPAGELYDMQGDGSFRDDWKIMFSAMLFMIGEKLPNWPRKVKDLKKSGMKLREAEALISDKHPALAAAGLFGSGIGHRLMWIESNTLVSVLKALRHLGIPALPLHDSALVARSEAESTAKVLEVEFAKLLPFGGEPVVKLDFGTE